MNSYVLRFKDIDKTKLNVVGGKGANLGELFGTPGICVPDGFCISTEAFQRTLSETPSINELLDQLSLLKVEDREKIAELSGEIRLHLEETAIPEDIAEEITRSLTRLGEKNAYAVRSSATAEDLPTASFAGQQDTYLNVIGKEAILKHISKCWASLYTERAVTYRIQNGFDHRKVLLSVVVQKMVFPKVSGILFTADPVTGNRKVLSIDAGFGLGEALVSGLVNADIYKVQSGKVTDKKISAKRLAVYALKDGGTKEQEIPPEQQKRQALTDEQILQLERIGRKVEEHFGCPQDIEWCLAEDTFFIVQSRPITTLYPIPEANDQENHVYLSVGHQQMMTNPLKPLGMSLMQLISNGRWFKAGGRLFVDVAPMLASPDGRKTLLNNMKQLEPLTKDAIMTIIERDFIKYLPNDGENKSSGNSDKVKPPADPQAQIENNPLIVSDLIRKSQTSIEELKQNIQGKSGTNLIDFILEDIQELKRILFDPQSSAVFTAAINASLWINEKMNEWLGEKNPADILSQSVPNNITSEMGLALMDVADVIRPYRSVIDYLQNVQDDNSLEKLVKLDGGQVARDAILSYLDKYGMRCSGEIDITKPRFSENPTALVPMILSNIKNFEPKASSRKFEQGRRVASKKEKELLERLNKLPDGEEKVKETKKMIDLIRNFIGYREYPKYGMVSRYFVYKQALLKEAERLVQTNVIHEKEDIYYLTFAELREVIATNKLDFNIICKRKEEYKLFEKLTPPRVITSEGEIITGEYKRENLPVGAMAGLPVSSGVIEGRARVILNMADANLEDGDILITAFTDPSWTPLFVSIKGLVTEVGGLMTHGAVIAREYGLPAVVGVENATRLIKDGQRIRVHGTDGYVEIL
ncbi:phosphoenolpyruvate synthase [Desulfosporosinus lacus]|uniref:Rifampicin phosphotransferase n=1 Tax=Desulfosporosinus lacus DSM 15449 TaxID=1121420 RepID=A0A1M5X8A6_9FIRM|nr:phosphoenolpyruvate synthase [Desulfosporosinus lacus]SHH96065.1 pyruvate, water dikinase [Desulfosporosinus lacus DSM 15449]